MGVVPASTLAAIRAPIVDPKTGMPTWVLIKKLQEYETKLNNAITLIGEIAAAAVIEGRTEGIGTTVVKLTSAGLLEDTDAILADGTGSPLTGGKRGFVALDTNNRLANSFRVNPVNVSAAPTASSDLSNDGAATAIPIAANTQQFGTSTVSYNSGSVDPGVFGTFYVFADDPTYAGGAVTYAFSTDPEDQVAAEGRITIGVITTTSGTPQSGGGNSGGSTPGGGGGRAYSFV